MLTVALPIGVTLSLLLVEATGLSAGGIITPAYVAIILDDPRELARLALLSAATLLVVEVLARFLFLYGTRRFSVTVLVGMTLGSVALLLPYGAPARGPELAAFGFIVPGLIAHQIARQGLWPTLIAIGITAPAVRLLILVVEHFA